MPTGSNSFSLTRLSLSLQLFIAVTIAVLLLIFDHYRNPYVVQLKTLLATVASPIQYVANFPSDFVALSYHTVRTKEQLLAENQRLRVEQTVLKAQLQKLVAIETENAHLRHLLGSQRVYSGRRLIAEVLAVSIDPFHHQLTVNKGSRDDVYVGQAVMDAEGIVGQVVLVTPTTAQVLLLTDSTHAIPVYNRRNGVRTIAIGSGLSEQLVLQHLPHTTDVKQDDVWVSSGLGGRFPKGLPVAQVTQVIHNNDDAFAQVIAQPMAAMNRNTQLLLLWADDDKPILSTSELE